MTAPPGGYRTALFDLDGTLVDSKDLILASFRHTMHTHFGSMPADEVWMRSLGTPLRAQFKEFAETPEELQALIDTYVEYNLREHERLIRPFEGIREAMVRLRQLGITLGIVTSKAEAGTRKSLAACALPIEWFEVVVTSDEPVPHKPDPAPVSLALERLGEPVDRAVYVGDSVWDMRAGRAAGVHTAAALWGPFPRELLAAESPDRMLETIPDLVPALSGAS